MTNLMMVQERGFKASVVFVHNDPVTGFTNMINRLIKSNRAMSHYYYVLCYPRFQGRIAYLQKEHPDVTLYCLDNSHNKGGVRVSIEEPSRETTPSQSRLSTPSKTSCSSSSTLVR